MLNQTPSQSPARRRYVPAIGPRLRKVLWVVFGLSALMAANAAYLASVTFLSWLRGVSYQNYFYLWMVLVHLAVGLVLIVPFIAFAIGHLKNARNRPNRAAVRAGYALLAIAIILLFSGIALLRLGPLTLRSPTLRNITYWAHVIAPLGVIWLYVLHRLAGPRIAWRKAVPWAGATAAIIGAMIYLNFRDPRNWNAVGPIEGVKYFEPSLARTASGKFISASTLMTNQYCLECHKDAYQGWFHSAHHFSSFNNPAYLFSVRETRMVALKRDGNVKAARWCAGCHDPVPFFSGAFDHPDYDDVHDPTSQAGITCVTCHAITHINSTRGNADYTIEEPIQYPFATSTNRFLRLINRQLIKAKPEFHKQTFLKPLHRSAEFCSTCHKVSIPGELNHYKEFLRGQNHYDTFLLSGGSGHGARSFYYPQHAKENCAACHMPVVASGDFGARPLDPGHPGELMIHDHLFLGGNTALPALRNDQATLQAEQTFLKNCVRIELFGIREGGGIDGVLHVVQPGMESLLPDDDYLLEVVVRNLTAGHPLTQGTVDSNELWLSVRASSGGQVIGQSGQLASDGRVDPWADFLNVYMLDRDGGRIDRRNVQDIFTPLYDHQIPPGSARVTHYRLHVPREMVGKIRVDLNVCYRKFDADYFQKIFGDKTVDTLPITMLASETVELPIGQNGAPTEKSLDSSIPAWQRWNDYGIGLMLTEAGGEESELRQAADAFEHVRQLGRADGSLNLARVFIKEGRLDEAARALADARSCDPPPPQWTLAWLSGQVEQQNGNLDAAIADFRSVLETRDDARGFDFSGDYIMRNSLGQAIFERSKLEGDPAAHRRWLQQAAAEFEKTLALDSENLEAHYALSQISLALGDAAEAAAHRAAHEKYRVDDNARDRAVALARKRDPAADHAAQAVAIYELRPPEPKAAPGVAQ
ncbi:MAG TPA: multiheme c-type cytochrome [Tepidisphaeraceae bacterium]|nr:multiheme c-type cytochrome [Tepidisphaeraceae bacterium]